MYGMSACYTCVCGVNVCGVYCEYVLCVVWYAMNVCYKCVCVMHMLVWCECECVVYGVNVCVVCGVNVCVVSVLCVL